MKLIRGSILHFLSDPELEDELNESSYDYFEDGGLLLDDGKVVYCGQWQQALTIAKSKQLEIEHVDYTGYLITPGFIDTHFHYAQTDVLASPGHGLLDWLERYTFPAERAFENPEWAESVAEFFCDELLQNGTTTALVFGTVHPQSVDAFFKVAQRRGLRMVAGKVMMDRHCPDYLSDTAQSSYDDTKRLIETWQGVDRLTYAITPRFAITSSEAQMEAVSTLAKEYPKLNIHSHLAENKAECAWVQELYPWSRSYLDVYDHYGLLREGAVYAHCIYLNDYDQQRMAESRASVAFSPTSNLFLGSGLLDLSQALKANVSVGIATDVGGGTSFSMLRTLAAAYQVAHLNGYVMSSLRAFYLATLAGAKALGLDNVIGNFEQGKEADFIVLDPEATKLISRRIKSCNSLEEKLFVWQTLGDDRSIAATYINGNEEYNKL